MSTFFETINNFQNFMQNGRRSTAKQLFHGLLESMEQLFRSCPYSGVALLIMSPNTRESANMVTMRVSAPRRMLPWKTLLTPLPWKKSAKTAAELEKSTGFGEPRAPRIPGNALLGHHHSLLCALSESKLRSRFRCFGQSVRLGVGTQRPLQRQVLTVFFLWLRIS